MFKCILCGYEGEFVLTHHKCRDRDDLNIVDCPRCGHRQLFPLLSYEEMKEEYDNDRSVRRTTGVVVAPGSDFLSMRKKFSEWTRMHVDMYWDILQKHKHILNLGSGYGFFEEICNQRDGKLFEIEGDEIGTFRLDNYVGGTVYNLDFLKDSIPDELIGKYDFIIAMHILEHLNEPIEYLKRIKPLFTQDGELLIEVPNRNCFLAELSHEYDEFSYFYDHVSYFTKETLEMTLDKAGYKDIRVYTKEIYSVENHINWCRTGKPFIQYNQMFLPDERLEFINREYKKVIGEMGKGYSLIAEARV